MDTIELKEKLLLAVLPNVAFDGWSVAALRAGSRSLGVAEAEAYALFPRAGAELVAAFSHWADREMLAGLGGIDIEALKVRERIAAALRARLAALGPHREAARRAMTFLALPQHVPLGLRLIYDTVDTAWYAAGDTATDFNFYTKRGLLAAVHAATMLYWIEDRSEGAVDTEAFLDRRIADALALPRIAGRFREAFDRLPNPARFLRAAQRR